MKRELLWFWICGVLLLSWNIANCKVIEDSESVSEKEEEDGLTLSIEENEGGAGNDNLALLSGRVRSKAFDSSSSPSPSPSPSPSSSSSPTSPSPSPSPAPSSSSFSSRIGAEESMGGGGPEEEDLLSIVVLNDHRKGEDQPQVQALTISGKGGSEAEAQRMKEAVAAIITSEVGKKSEIERTLEQVFEESSDTGSMINIVKSTLSNLTHLEDTINAMFDSNVDSKDENLGTNSVRSISLGEISDLNPESKANVVNVFIVNILGNADQESLNKSETNNNVKISYLQDILKTQDQNVPIRVERPASDNIQSILQSLQMAQRPQTTVNTPPQVINALKDQAPNLLQSYMPNLLKVKETVVNPHGLNLNKNTILNLLPQFVRHTTIPPFFPLYDATGVNKMGVKPSVLGLLPNQVFGITDSKPELQESSNLGILIRKRGEVLPSFDKDNFSQRMAPALSTEVDSSNISDQFLGNVRESSDSNNKGKALTPTRSRVQAVSKGQQSNQNVSSKLEIKNQELAQNLFKSLKSNKTHPAQKANKNSYSLKYLEKKKKPGTIVQLVKAMTLGSLPSGLAFASAFLGKKRRKRDALFENEEIRMENNPGDHAISLAIDRLNKLNRNQEKNNFTRSDIITSIDKDESNKYSERVKIDQKINVVNDDEVVLNFLSSAINGWQNESSKIAEEIENADESDYKFKDYSTDIEPIQDNLG